MARLNRKVTDSLVTTMQVAKAIQTIILAEANVLRACELLDILIRFMAQFQSGPATSTSTSGSEDFNDHSSDNNKLDFSEFPKGTCGKILLRLPSACKDLESTWTVCHSDESNIRKIAEREDFRIQDIQQGELKKVDRISPTAKLLRCRAERNLSAGYETFKVAQDGKHDSIAAYARQPAIFKDKVVAERGTRDGSKYKLLERKVGFSGISAIVCQAQGLFSNLPDDDLDTLVKFLYTKEYRKVLSTAKKWTPRLDKLQASYDEAVQTYFRIREGRHLSYPSRLLPRTRRKTNLPVKPTEKPPDIARVIQPNEDFPRPRSDGRPATCKRRITGQIPPIMLDRDCGVPESVRTAPSACEEDNGIVSDETMSDGGTLGHAAKRLRSSCWGMTAHSGDRQEGMHGSVSKSAQETSTSSPSHQQLAIEMDNGYVVQSQGSPPTPIPLSDLSTGAPQGETAAVTTIDLHPNVLFAGQPSVGTVANNPNLTADSYIVSRADDPTFVTSWQPQTIHERNTTDASGIVSSEPQIDNMPLVPTNIYRPTSKTVCMPVQRDVDTSVLDQPFQAVDAGMNVDGYMQGQLAATSQARSNDSDGPPVVRISVDTNEQTVSDAYDDGASLDMWAAPRISDALFAPTSRYSSADQIRHYYILYPPSAAAYPDTFDAAPRICL
ncbi:hypothetical protein DM02DRAFT_733795 [Periconia macrospinosa]|uniref:Uncharacterized protein n=1 Tax=Periconia macrospinosa TaxID=97972 RepID=A0A2V1D2K6_9PLEO|nr:hypothetical protein DM02DRAFT_733795 [Periconia macrospinosa]